MVKWKTRAAVLLKRQAEVLLLRPSPNHEVWYSGSTRSASLLFLLPFPYLSSCTCFTTRDFTHQVHIPLHFLTKGWLIFSLLFLLLCELERFFNAQLRNKPYKLFHLFAFKYGMVVGLGVFHEASQKLVEHMNVPDYYSMVVRTVR